MSANRLDSPGAVIVAKMCGEAGRACMGALRNGRQYGDVKKAWCGSGNGDVNDDGTDLAGVVVLCGVRRRRQEDNKSARNVSDRGRTLRAKG